VQDINISLITVAYNAEHTIARCIESVIAQNYNKLQYIVIDGGSADGTLQVINKYKSHISLIISEPDNGVYDAMNKGIQHATGDIVGTLNADDFFAGSNVLTTIGDAFSAQKAGIVFGNLNYVDENETITRKWRTRPYKKGIFKWGWMPPHPTFYCKRSLFERLGYYSLDYGTAADYELMLRFMHLNNIGGFYIDKVLVNMQRGGMSNSSPKRRLKAWGFDLKAMRKNKLPYPLLTLIIKPLRKITQYL
jgi:glycosyltransferase involved in cell wall biosynthesis